MLESMHAFLAGKDGFSFFQTAIFSLAATLAVAVFAVLEVFKPPHKRRRPNGGTWKMPPGPSGIPLFGSLYEVKKPKIIGNTIQSFGEMATVQVGSKTWVVLNSNRVVSELINRRGAITNGRPDYPVSSDLMAQSKRSLLLKVPAWSERRRVTHSVLSGSSMKKYSEYQDIESVQLLAGYVCQPEKWFQHHARYSNSVIYQIAFGHRVLSVTPQLAAIRKVHEIFLENNPPQNTIDCFPKLSQIPHMFQWWRRPAERLGQWTREVYEVFWNPIYQEILSGNAPSSFARDVLVGEDARFTGTADDAMFLAGELIEAGGETTRLSLNIFIMASLFHTAAFKKARAELDSVCGSNAERLPNFSDEPSLKFVLAFVKELLRWRPLIPWGTEHCLTEDLEFEGYTFPKDTNFVINNLATSQDPKVFENAREFKPERWLDGHESDIIRGTTAFGGGRRVCVGYRLAQKSLFINVSRLIYCFDFHSKGILDSEELNHHAEGEPFPVTPIIRSKWHQQLILEDAKRLDLLHFANDEVSVESIID